MEKAWQVQTKGSRCAGSLGRGGEVVDGGERQEDRLMLFSGSAWLGASGIKGSAVAADEIVEL